MWRVVLLTKGFGEGLSTEWRLEGSEIVNYIPILDKKYIPGRGNNSKCKGPEVRVSLASPRNSKSAIVAGAESGTGNVVEEVREETGMLKRAWQGSLEDHSKDSAITLSDIKRQFKVLSRGLTWPIF